MRQQDGFATQSSSKPRAPKREGRRHPEGTRGVSERGVGYHHQSRVMSNELENAHARVDPRNIQLDSVLAPAPVVAVEFPPTSQETLRLPVTANKSRVQWWPMFAAALIGIGVSLLALGALARFGQL